MKRVVAAVVGTAAVAAVVFGLLNIPGDTPVAPAPIPSVIPDPIPVDPARDVLGRPARHDFKLGVEVLGRTIGAGNKVVMIEGDEATFRIEADQDCYLGIWHIEQTGDRTAIAQRFPNDKENDNLLPAGEARTVPGGGYTFTMTASQGPEYLHVVAFSKRWQAPSQTFAEPVTPKDLAEWQLPEKGMLTTEDESPPMAEVLLALEVRSKPEESDPEEENR